ncbi:ATP-binding protein [Mucilaginibacter auburnensis]|uniref:histidine kinase n=1 Tax=Mucilaginibacter auburnensis TaxID=1457233 RepID=A0A2H9VP46_9SPHI|nr:ATP-binding protein [Mucilaginibacter auburnensis]PJJ80082.1 signal transduction histidine kinase [Mucilaginibacter auburnensis]
MLPIKLHAANHRYVKIALLLFVVLLLMSNTGMSMKLPAYPTAKKGVLDLRSAAMNEKIPLNGEWLFYWQQLLAEGDKASHPNIVEFPSLWNSGHKINGRELPAFGYASYRLTVLLPKKHGDLRLTVPDVYSAYALYVNGKQVATNGKVSRSDEGFEPYWQYKTIDFGQNADTLNLVLEIANFVHSKGGITKPLYIGDREVVRLDRQQDEAIDLLLTGCLIMGGLFFFGLYLFGNRDRAILLFSLYVLVYSYRIIGIDNYVLHTIIPNMDWYIAVRLEYLTLFVGIGLFGLYSRYLYPLDINGPTLNVIAVVCFAFALASLVLSPYYFTQLINPFLVLMMFCLIYIPSVYLIAFRRKRPGSIYALSSSIALMFVFAISLFHYWGFLPQLQVLTFIGYVSFFFLQSLVLSHRVSFVLKNAQQQAEQGLKAKTEFLSTMSHEIRTPLNSVIGMSHLMLKNDPRPDQREHLDVIIFSANNLLGIVNDILDYNKIEAGKITFERIEMDLLAIARNVVNSLQTSANDKGITLKLVGDEQLKSKLIGDPIRISQVITNLVHNAIKFTPSGFVEVSITVQRQTDTNITVKVAVKDTGIGISADKQDLIFERFTQADSSTSRGFGGTGLGLAISKRILELQNSSLELISAEGKGSVFYFVQTFQKVVNTLPEITEKNKLPQQGMPFAGIDLLLVEDNPLNVMVAQTFLKKWGAGIDVAVNGEEALQKLDVNKHKLVLMDLHMPVMDGYQAAKAMRNKGVTLPIIALTANLPDEVKQEIADAGIDGIVVKPFLPDELYGKVWHHLFK